MARMEESKVPLLATGEEIECPVTSWYFKRMGMLGAMLVVFAALFLYDGKWGYPAKNKKAEIKERFDEEVLKGYDEAQKAGRLDQWRAEMKTKNWPVDDNGEPPKWLSYAAEHGMDEKPKKYSDREIEEQFWWGGGMLVGAMIVGVFVLMSRGKRVRADSEGFISPEGVEVPFASVFKVDKRKWENKGLATICFRDSGGREKKVALDCMKYDEQGVERVLRTLLSKFKGELIEKVDEPDEDEGGVAAENGES